MNSNYHTLRELIEDPQCPVQWIYKERSLFDASFILGRKDYFCAEFPPVDSQNSSGKNYSDQISPKTAIDAFAQARVYEKSNMFSSPAPKGYLFLFSDALWRQIPLEQKHEKTSLFDHVKQVLLQAPKPIVIGGTHIYFDPYANEKRVGASTSFILEILN